MKLISSGLQMYCNKLCFFSMCVAIKANHFAVISGFCSGSY